MENRSEVLSEEQVEELVRELDSESNFRKLSGFLAKLTSIVAIGLSVFQLYTAWSPLESIKQRAIHLTFVMVLAFLLYPGRKKSKQVSWLDWVLAAGSLITIGYLGFNWDGIVARNGYLEPFEYVIGGIGMVLVIEAARRVLGKELVIMAIVFLAYAYFGKYIPGLLNHRGYSVQRIIEHMYFTAEGLFGVTLGVSATYMFLYILMGSFLSATGLSQLINDGAMAVAGRWSGGPAKVALIASGMMGTLNGSAVANAASTGAFTIPLMKKVGYKPEFAAAIEGSGSVGGQIMPPVMGAAAFLIAEYLRIDYGKIVLAAFLPAVLYYVSIYIMVHLEAKKLGLRGLTKEELPNLWAVLKSRGHMIIPVIILMYLLLSGKTPMYAGVVSIIATFAASWLPILWTFKVPENAMTLPRLLQALEGGARGAVGVAIATAVVGYVVGTASLTSLGLNLGHSILQLADGNILLGLFLTMITSIVVGTGVPTTATYIIVATVAAPALVQMGIPALAAHLFVFYYGAMSDVTPPTALAPYTAAGIAGSDPARTTWIAWKLSLSGFIVPFFFAVNPELLLGVTPFTAASLIPIITAILGIAAISAGLQGWLERQMNWLERALLIVGGLLLILPELLPSLAGLVLAGGVVLWQRLGRRTAPTTA